MRKVYFWQLMVTPHIIELALELNKLNLDVYYCASVDILPTRLNQGWDINNKLKSKTLKFNNKKDINYILNHSDIDSIHICQGIRGNGIITNVQYELRKRNYKYWIIMETVKSNYILNYVKKIIYGFIYSNNRLNINGFLAIGEHTKKWLSDCGIPLDIIYPFAYFLKDNNRIDKNNFAIRSRRKFCFIYVGRLIKLKRVSWFLLALSKLKSNDFEVIIVGDGNEKIPLQKLANKILKCETTWLGVKSNSTIQEILCTADCLVLPSKREGWGAVISESLIMGTPVVCSDSCGASIAIKSTNFGRLFKSTSLNDLVFALNNQLKNGKISNERRKNIASYSKLLGARHGAYYLKNIISNTSIKPYHPILSFL